MSEAQASTVRKTFRYKLLPSPLQERALDEVIWRCRILYNAALEQRIILYRQRGVTISCYAQKRELKELRAALPEYGAINSHILQDVLTRLDKTYQSFFRRVKRGEKAGFPRFKGRSRYHSFTYNEYGNGARLDNGYLVLSKIGRIAIRWSRPLEGKTKTVTISREVDGWYVLFSCAEVPVQALPATGQDTGIDLGLESFATLSDGSQIANPRIFHVAQMALKRAQRRASRRKKGSHRRRKAIVLLAKAHQQVRRARADFHHKTALALVRQYDTIYHEDLRVANLAHNRPLAKSIADVGWGAFLAILAFKAACAGKRAVGVNPAYTSQTCSGCGVVAHKRLSVRWHTCEACGASLHRDHNAALNILALGRQTSAAGQAVQALTWASGPSVA